MSSICEQIFFFSMKLIPDVIQNLCNTTFVARVNKVPLSSIWHWSEYFLCFICGQYQVLVYKSLLFISLQN